MNAITAAVEFEWLKLRRATVTWVASAVLVLVVPLLAAGFLAAGRSDSASQLALKARAMVTDTGWSGQFMVTGQILSVAVLIVVGIVASWAFGREFTDRTIGGLLSLPTSRVQLASAKFLVVTGWAILTCAAAAITTVIAGLATGTGGIGPQDWAVLGKMFLAALLTIALTAPLALAASLGRGYLTGIAILLSIVVVTQIATTAGLGGWFPYAAPGLWLGLGGPEAAAEVTGVQLLLPVPVGAAAVTESLLWWNSPAATRDL
ncbi:MAG: ABC transporter permease [Stackebrandtia sp.]